MSDGARSPQGLSKGNLTKALVGFVAVVALTVAALGGLGYALWSLNEKYFGPAEQGVAERTTAPVEQSDSRSDGTLAGPRSESASVQRMTAESKAPDTQTSPTASAPSSPPVASTDGATPSNEGKRSPEPSAQPGSPPAAAVARSQPVPAPSPDPAARSAGPAESPEPVLTPPSLEELQLQLGGADSKAALEAIETLARTGNADAQFVLGGLYRAGEHVEADPVLALGWLMQAGAREHLAAAHARDELYASLDDSLRARGESKSRSLGLPMPPGWIYSKDRSVRVWGPGWYRNGTWEVEFDVGNRDGLVHGEGRIEFKALLYGRTSRTYEGNFRAGYLTEDAMSGTNFDFLPTNEYRIHTEPGDTAPGLVRIWRQMEIPGLRLTACGKNRATVYGVLEASAPVLEDEALRKAAIAAIQRGAALCPTDPRGAVTVVLLPPDHQPVVERGDTEYEPSVAELYVQTSGEPETWRASVKNFARRRHEKAAREAERERKKMAREREKARILAAAKSRPIPEVRGLTLGMSRSEVEAALEGEVSRRDPPALPDGGLPPLAQFAQTYVLNDRSQLTVRFASKLHQHRVLSVSLEQQLSDGPAADAMRTGLTARYGAPDTSTGGDTWLTWWLTSATGRVKGALLRARLLVRNERLESYRLLLTDSALGQQDEKAARSAKASERRNAARAAQENSKSDQVKF